MKIDEEGNEVWNKTYGSNGDDYCGGISVVDDGIIIVGSLNASASLNKGDLCFIMIDDNGNEIWNRRFGGDFLDYGGVSAKKQVMEDILSLD